MTPILDSKATPMRASMTFIKSSTIFGFNILTHICWKMKITKAKSNIKKKNHIFKIKSLVYIPETELDTAA